MKNGDGTFSDMVKYEQGLYNGAIQRADIDNDGDLDIVCANGRLINTLTILYNQVQ